MNFIQLSRNALRQFRKSLLWSLFMAILLSFCILLFINFFSMLGRRDLFFKTLNFLDSNDANMVLVDRIPQLAENYYEDDSLEADLRDFLIELEIENKIGGIQYLDQNQISMLQSNHSVNTSQFRDYENVVFLIGQYINFAGLNIEDINEAGYMAMVSPDLEMKIGGAINLLGEEYPISRTLDYSYPDDLFRSYYLTQTPDENISTDSTDLNESTLFLLTDDINMLLEIYSPSFLIQQVQVFGDSNVELNNFNDRLSEHGAYYAKIIPIESFFGQAPDANADRLNTEILIIFIGILFISFIILLNYFRNIEDNSLEYKIHQSFGASNNNIFVWILLYTFLYTSIALILTLVLVNVNLPELLNWTILSLILVFYVILCVILASVSFRRYLLRNSNA